MERYSTLIDKTDRSYLHIIGNEQQAQVVKVDRPVLLDENTTLKSLQEKYPTVVLPNVAIVPFKGTTGPVRHTQQKDDLKSIFEFPQNGDKCPICNGNEPDKAALIYIAGTENNGVGEAQPMHIDCLLKNAVYYREEKMIAVVLDGSPVSGGA